MAIGHLSGKIQGGKREGEQKGKLGACNRHGLDSSGLAITWHALEQPCDEIFTITRTDNDFAFAGKLEHHALAAGDAVNQLAQKSAAVLRCHGNLMV